MIKKDFIHLNFNHQISIHKLKILFYIILNLSLISILSIVFLLIILLQGFHFKLKLKIKKTQIYILKLNNYHINIKILKQK